MSTPFYSKQQDPCLSDLPINGCQPSTLISKIYDINFYEDVISIVLQLSKEAGVKCSELVQLQESLLKAKGIQKKKMLNESESNIVERDEVMREYSGGEKWISSNQQIEVLGRIQKLISQERQKQFEFHAMRKVIEEWEKNQNVGYFYEETTRKENFRSKYFSNKQKTQSIISLINRQKPFNKSLNTSHILMRAFTKLKTMYGHIDYPPSDQQQYCQVFNAIFDISEKLIISAGEDGLIKIWSKDTGLLLSNLKGHTTFIHKVTVSQCNKYLISTAGDGIRFFDLTSLTSIGCWQSSHIIQVATIREENLTVVFGEIKRLYLLSEEFMLLKSKKYLQESDFTIFSLEIINEKQNNHILQLVFNKNNRTLLIGFECGKLVIANYDNLVQNRTLSLLPVLATIQAHNQEIMQIKWHKSGQFFATGCKGGFCKLWQFGADCFPVFVNEIKMSKRKRKVFSCSYIVWNCTQTHLIASFDEIVQSDEIRQSRQGEVLVYSLQDRVVTCELSKILADLNLGAISSIDSHPIFPNIILICETLGKVIIVDIFLKTLINIFWQTGVHLQHPQFLLIPTQCKFSRDGMNFILGTQYGTVSIYGYDMPQFYKFCPEQQSLSTDYLQIRLQDKTNLPISLLSNGEQQIDVNCLQRGEVGNFIKMPYTHMLKNQYILYKDSIDIQYKNSKDKEIYETYQSLQKHKNQYELPKLFLDKIEYRFQQFRKREDVFQRHYEELNLNSKSMIISQNLKNKSGIQQTINQKMQKLRLQLPSHIKYDNLAKPYLENQKMEDVLGETVVRTGRRLKKYSERMKNQWQGSQPIYQDDFDYNSEKEEEYDQNMADEDQEESEDYDDQEEQIYRNRKRSRRSDYHYHESDEEQRTRKRSTRRKPAEQVKILQEDYDKVRKRIKSSQQQEVFYQPQKNSNLLPACQRCNIDLPETQCSICKVRQFCQGCKIYRGSEQPFKCFSCQFHNNNNDIQKVRVSSKAYQETRRFDFLMVPQIGDEFYYFFQGYQEFLSQNIKQLNNLFIYQNNLNFQLIPHQNNQNLTMTPLCQVVNIHYAFPLKQSRQIFDIGNMRRPRNQSNSTIQMIIQMKTLNLAEDYKFYVFYVPGVDFLVRKQLYDSVIKVKTQIIINNIVKDQNGEQVQIVDVGYFDKNYTTLWKYLKVRKTQGKRLRASTTSDKRINPWRIDIIPIPSFHCDIKRQEKERVLKELLLIEKQKNSQQYIFFEEYVNVNDYNYYYEIVEIGMCLRVIRQRLINNYYRSTDQLKKDIHLIAENSYKFNGDSTNQVTKLAEQLVSRLIFVIEDMYSEKQKSGEKDKKKEKQKQKEKEKEKEIMQFEAEDYSSVKRFTRRQNPLFKCSQSEKRSQKSENVEEPNKSENFQDGDEEDDVDSEYDEDSQKIEKNGQHLMYKSKLRSKNNSRSKATRSNRNNFSNIHFEPEITIPTNSRVTRSKTKN